MYYDLHLYEVRMKASHTFKWLLACLAMAVLSTIALFQGFPAAKPLVFFFVIAGAISLFAGLILRITGHLQDDVTGQKRDKKDRKAD